MDRFFAIAEVGPAQLGFHCLKVRKVRLFHRIERLDQRSLDFIV